MKFEVRLANRQDLGWIRRLAVEAAVFSLPPTRAVSAQALRARVKANLAGLGEAEDTVLLVAWETDRPSETRAGYLILLLNEVDDASGEPQSVIYDLAVEERFRGTAAVRQLILRAAQVTRENGLAYMAGEVTAENRRAYLRALRLGFCLERYRIVLPVSSHVPGGDAEAPG